MKLSYPIFNIEKVHWRTALWWLGYTLIFGLLPLWVGIFMLRLFSHNVGLSTVADEGQFALYSAAILSTGLYFSAREFRYFRLKSRSGFIAIFVPLLIISALLFGGITIANTMQLEIDLQLLRLVSIAIFIASIPLVYISAARNEAGITKDFADTRNEQIQKLEIAFDGLGGAPKDE